MDSVKSPLADLITSTLVQACISSRSSDRLWRLVHDGNEIVIFENAEDKTQYLLIKNAITPLLMAYSELRSELNLRIYPCLGPAIDACLFALLLISSASWLKRSSPSPFRLERLIDLIIISLVDNCIFKPPPHTMF